MVTVADEEKQAVILKLGDNESAHLDSERHELRHEYGIIDGVVGGIGDIRQGNGVLRFLSNLEARIGGTAAFEAMGIERIPEDKRYPPQILNVSYHVKATTLPSHKRKRGKKGVRARQGEV